MLAELVLYQKYNVNIFNFNYNSLLWEKNNFVYGEPFMPKN
jgi:hypothetical protein